MAAGARRMQGDAVQEEWPLEGSNLPVLTFLHPFSVRAGTKEGYQSMWQKFVIWAAHVEHRMDSAAGTDLAADHFFDTTYKYGVGLASRQGPVAIVVFRRASRCRGKSRGSVWLPACPQVLKGFNKKAPSKSGLLLPWEAAAMIALQTLLARWQQTAVAILAQFELFLRHDRDFRRVVSLSLALRAELGRVLDRKFTVRLKANWRKAELEKERQHAVGVPVMVASLVNMTVMNFNTMLPVKFRKLQERSGVARTYRLRCGVAWRGYAKRLRGLHEVKQAALWQGNCSSCRCKKEGKVLKMLNALPDIWEAHVRPCAKLVYKVLADKR